MSKPDFWEGYVPEPVKPAQQEPKIDIYRSFEQWKSGNVLEHGVPRTEHYSEAQLDLVEMGWNYGYDAGRAVEQALDKKAENARELGLDYDVKSDHRLMDMPAQQLIHCKHRRENNGVCPHHNLHCGWPKCNEPEQPAQQEPVACKTLCELCAKRGYSGCANAAQITPIPSPPAQQEPVVWRNAAIRVGEDLCSVGPFGYYDMTAEQWLDWALSVVTVHAPPAQRTWVGLSDESIVYMMPAPVLLRANVERWDRAGLLAFARAIEAKLRSKNNG